MSLTEKSIAALLPIVIACSALGAEADQPHVVYVPQKMEIEQTPNTTLTNQDANETVNEDVARLIVKNSDDHTDLFDRAFDTAPATVIRKTCPNSSELTCLYVADGSEAELVYFFRSSDPITVIMLDPVVITYAETASL